MTQPTRPIEHAPRALPLPSGGAALRPRTSRAVTTLSLVALAALSGCKGVTLAYGSDVATARANADAFASALEQRFTNVTRTPRFNRARTRIARYSLAPSKLATDTSIWTASRTTRSGAERDLELAGALTNGEFLFTEHVTVPLPVRTGDQRHFIQLQQLDGKDDWGWKTQVDQAIGALPPARAADIFRALFASAERPSAQVRADYKAAFPRMAQSMGRVFTVDSIITTPQTDGSTLVAFHVLVSSAQLKDKSPAMAKFLAKYVEPSKYRYRLSDKSGSDWFDAQATDKRLIFRFRSHNGELQPLLGAARRMPDTLTINVDLLAKLSMFTVGVTKMQGEFVHVHTATERGWAMRFTKEPDWHLPLFTERMLRTPLRRPFEGQGMLFSMIFRTGPDGQTLLTRRFDAVIRESAIVRMLGNLGFGAMNDYQGTVEAEEHRFVAEGFAAMRADIAALKLP
jgi:hypothetical protein